MKLKTRILLALVVLSLGVALGLGIVTPQSSARIAGALNDLKVIAVAPHPYGSPEAARVRDTIIRKLKDMGYAPEIRSVILDGKKYQNIVATRAGQAGNTDEIWLVAHYDSVPWGPGAADDGIGIAALLESARSLTDSPLNTVRFVFTDDEEGGLNGAEALVTKDAALLSGCRVLLNFEARGNKGVYAMFQTGPGGLNVVRAYSSHGYYPVAFSFSADIYRYMKNDTDFTPLVVNNTGTINGLNFACSGGYENYHRPSDTVDNLDFGTLTQAVMNAVQLSAYFAQADLSTFSDSTEAVYFPVLPGILVVYPQAVSLPLLLFAAAGFILLVILFYRRKVISLPKVGLSLAVLLAAIALVVLLSIPLIPLIIKIAGPSIPFFDIFLPSAASVWYLFGACLLIAALIALLRTTLLKGLNRREIILGQGIFWLILSVVSLALFPGGSYLFLWPLIFGLAALALEFIPGSGTAWKTASGLIFTIIPLSLLFMPLVPVLIDTLTVSLGLVHMILTVISAWWMLAFLGPDSEKNPASQL